MGALCLDWQGITARAGKDPQSSIPGECGRRLYNDGCHCCSGRQEAVLGKSVQVHTLAVLCGGPPHRMFVCGIAFLMWLLCKMGVKGYELICCLTHFILRAPLRLVVGMLGHASVRVGVEGYTAKWREC